MSKQKLQGIGIGSGISVSKAFVLKEESFNFDVKSKISANDELSLFDNALLLAQKQLNDLSEIAAKNISEEKAEIFKAHLEILKDDVILDEIKTLINQNYTAAHAVNEVFNKYMEIFSHMEDKYFKERASDLFDIKKRMLSIVCNVVLPDLLLIKEECIIIAHDLTPSETILLDKKYVKGFVTDIGGATSHSAIMAKTLGILAVVSTKTATQGIKNGEIVAIDSIKGVVEYSLDKKDVTEWEQKQNKYFETLKELEEYRDKECITVDKVEVNLMGNIGQPKDVKKVLHQKGKGIGLFRSEFLYMDSATWPTEEEQFDSYKTVLESFPENYVTIRTLDIGGDKHLNYYTFPKEANPFLGYRAIRMTLKEVEVFKTQLKALLKSSAHGHLKIMFPMIAVLDEFIQAKNLVLKYAEELRQEGYKVSNYLKIGMMVEIPSSALMAEKFATVADFFSIGSNDLIQYTHAVDRMSEEINYLYQPNSPSILKLIKMSADAAHKHKKEISVCGEMASNILSVPILIGFGITNLSMSSNSIPAVKRIINNIKMSDCKELAEQALNMENEQQVNDLINAFLEKNNLTI